MYACKEPQHCWFMQKSAKFPVIHGNAVEVQQKNWLCTILVASMQFHCCKGWNSSIILSQSISIRSIHSTASSKKVSSPSRYHKRSFTARCSISLHVDDLSHLCPAAPSPIDFDKLIRVLLSNHDFRFSPLALNSGFSAELCTVHKCFSRHQPVTKLKSSLKPLQSLCNKHWPLMTLAVRNASRGNSRLLQFISIQNFFSCRVLQRL